MNKDRIADRFKQHLGPTVFGHGGCSEIVFAACGLALEWSKRALSRKRLGLHRPLVFDKIYVLSPIQHRQI